MVHGPLFLRYDGRHLTLNGEQFAYDSEVPCFGIVRQPRFDIAIPNRQDI